MTNRTTLLVIDVQNGFVTKHAKHIVPVITTLINVASEHKVPVIATRFLNKPDSQYVKLMNWRKFMAPPAIDLIPQVAERCDYVIEKGVYSSLTTDFWKLMSTHHWDHFVICGIATEGCVMKTAVDIFELNLVPIVVKDACASHDGEYYHKMGMEIIKRYIGVQQVVDHKTAIRILSNTI